MPASFNIRISESDLAALKLVTAGIKNGAPRALSQAINKTLTGARTDMVQQASDTYNLTKTRIRKDIDVRKRTSVADLSGRVSAIGKSVRFVESGAYRYSSRILARGGVSAKIKRVGTRERWPRAFGATMPKSGHYGFFQREKLPSGRYVGRLPITQLSGPAIESAFSTRQYPTAMPTVENKVKARLDKNIGYQIDFELSKF